MSYSYVIIIIYNIISFYSETFTIFKTKEIISLVTCNNKK